MKRKTGEVRPSIAFEKTENTRTGTTVALIKQAILDTGTEVQGSSSAGFAGLAGHVRQKMPRVRYRARYLFERSFVFEISNGRPICGRFGG